MDMDKLLMVAVGALIGAVIAYFALRSKINIVEVVRDEKGRILQIVEYSGSGAGVVNVGGAFRPVEAATP